MTSPGKTPFLENLLTTGAYDDVTTESEQKRSRISDAQTTYSNPMHDQTFARNSVSTRTQVLPYFVDISSDNPTQSTWTQISTGQNSLHYYHPGKRWYTDDNANPFRQPVTFLPFEANIPDTNDTRPACLSSPQPVPAFTPVRADLQVENNSSCMQSLVDTTGYQFYSQASNQLQHFTLPFYQHHPLNQHESIAQTPISSYEQTIPLSHYNFPESSNIISPDPPYQHLTSMAQHNSDNGQPTMLLSGDLPNQTLPNFYQFNYLPRESLLQEYFTQTQVNSPACNEIQNTNFPISNNESNLGQLFDSCSRTDQCRRPLIAVDSDTIPRNAREEIPENSAMYTRISVGKPLAQPAVSSNIKEQSRKTSCLHDSENIKTFVPKLYEKLEKDMTHSEQPLCLLKEASHSEQVKAQVDEFMNSPKKKRSPGIRTLPCGICGRKLSRPSTLKIHMRQHSGERPFKCTMCPKSFAQPSLLQSHRRTHTGERPFTCSTCSKAFTHASALKTHKRTHTGERPHKCPVSNCGLAFSDSSTLSKHSRVHTGERPYPCNICGKRFTQSGNMNKHKRTVHKISNDLSMETIKFIGNSMILSEILESNE